MSFINFAVPFTLEDKRPLQRWVHPFDGMDLIDV